MIKSEEFVPNTDRYHFDFNLCHFSKGWAQWDSCQDSSWYGKWINPELLTIVTFSKGDIIIQTAENEQEFIQAIKDLRQWHLDKDVGFKGIDAATDDCKQRFISMGLLNLLYF